MSNQQASPNLNFIQKISPLFELVGKYFRYEVHGLENIPKRKALVVMNHGIIPFHGFLIAKKILDRHKTVPRGLAADFLFHIPGLRQFFLKGGAVRANPKSAEALLKTGHVVLLAPGGIYEALLAKPGFRRIPWERRKGFVALAIKTKTPIIPTYCPAINATYINSYFLLRPRIKLMEWSRFSFPLCLGLGLLPLPVKLVHWVGKPISVKKKKGETFAKQVERIHQEVITAIANLAKKS